MMECRKEGRMEGREKGGSEGECGVAKEGWKGEEEEKDAGRIGRERGKG